MKKQIVVRVDEELAKAIKQRALDEETTMQDIVERSMKLYLNPTQKETYRELPIGQDFKLRLTTKEYTKLLNNLIRTHGFSLNKRD